MKKSTKKLPPEERFERVKEAYLVGISEGFKQGYDYCLKTTKEMEKATTKEKLPINLNQKPLEK